MTRKQFLYSVQRQATARGEGVRTYLDGHDVSAECYAAYESDGRVELFKRNEQGQFYVQPGTDHVAREIKHGIVRIYVLGRTIAIHD